MHGLVQTAHKVVAEARLGRAGVDDVDCFIGVILGDFCDAVLARVTKGRSVITGFNGVGAPVIDQISSLGGAGSLRILLLAFIAIAVGAVMSTISSSANAVGGPLFGSGGGAMVRA